MAPADRLVVLIGPQGGSLSPAEVATCADGFADLHFLADSGQATPALFEVAEALAPTLRADFLDRDACLDVVRRSGATAVGTFTDRLCPLAAWLNGRLRGEAAPAALWGRKDAQRQALRDAGLSQVRSARVHDGQSLRAFVQVAGFPVVVKPINGYASHDVWLLRRDADVDEFLVRTGIGPGRKLDHVFAEQLIIGETWAGPQRADYVSAEVFRPGRRGGAGASPFVTDRLPLAWPFRETGLVLPSMIAPDRQQLIVAAAERALDAVGALQGAFHVEIKPKFPAPEIIEVNGRLGGFISRLVRYGTGENLGRLALSCVLGRERDLALRWDRCALVLLFQPPPDAVGITRAPSRREIGRLRGVVGVDELSPAGTAVDWRNGTNRAAAWVWLTAESHGDLHERLMEMATFLDDRFTFSDQGGCPVRNAAWLDRISGHNDRVRTQ